MRGARPGFKSYRLNIVGSLPRSSIPGPLWSRAAYDQLLDDYRRMEFAKDGSELWWDIRPLPRLPTIEMRICDVCTRIEDAVCIAALYASLIRWLLRKGSGRRAAARAAHRDHHREPVARPALRSARLSRRYARGRADRHRGLRNPPRRGAGRRRPCAGLRGRTPPHTHHHPRGDRRRPAGSTTSASAAWKETRRRRPCAAWSISCSPRAGRGSGECAETRDDQDKATLGTEAPRMVLAGTGRISEAIAGTIWPPGPGGRHPPAAPDWGTDRR